MSCFNMARSHPFIQTEAYVLDTNLIRTHRIIVRRVWGESKMNYGGYELDAFKISKGRAENNPIAHLEVIGYSFQAKNKMRELCKQLDPLNRDYTYDPNFGGWHPARIEGQASRGD